MCFHFQVSHLQGIIQIFSREHKAFLLLPVTCQIVFILDTMIIIATGTVRATVEDEYFTGAFHIHQIGSCVYTLHL